MERFTVTCAKTAEPIDMPFWMKTWVGPRNHVLDGGADLPTGTGNFQMLSGLSKLDQLRTGINTRDSHARLAVHSLLSS